MNLDKYLQDVQKPARYTGGELNSIVKDKTKVDIRYAFCFPDVYEVGMSHLGMKILYGLLNSRTDTWCERVFAPWEDMEEAMRRESSPLFALESRDDLRQFDFLGFTLQYEMSYTNILNMLELSGIPLLSADRGQEDPIICMGGPCVFNPEPIADFCDFFVIGEAEEVIMDVMDIYLKYKGDKQTFLREIAQLDGIYVPSFYDVEYNEDGTIQAYHKTEQTAKDKVQKRIVQDLDAAYYPEELIVPYMEIVHDRMMLELQRGCIRGCRFCQAGIIYRPIRQRSVETLCDLAGKLIDSTGYEEISMTSLSTSDYGQLDALCDGLLALTEDKKVSLALPSLRVDNFTVELMQKVQKVRKSSLTFAPEAGTQRMRDVINKGVLEEDLMRSGRMAFEGGWSNIKLYFMIGLPTETNEDVSAIVKLGNDLLDQYYAVPKENRGKNVRITVSVSSFVPKPHTPFQWESQNTVEQLKEKHAILRETPRRKAVSVNYHMSQLSSLEGVFSRGDRRLSQVLINAHRLGCKFDAWDEYFSYDKWKIAFEQAGLSMDFYANRERDLDEVLPWDIIDCGVSKDFLLREREQAFAGTTTPNCREKCSGCGISMSFAGVCQ